MASTKTTGLKCLVILTDSNNKPIAGQRGATLSRTAETIDTTSKDDGLWASAIAGYRSWSVEVEGAWLEGDERLKALDQAFTNGTPINVAILMNANTPGKGRVGGTYGEYTAKESYTGEAYITDFSYELPYDDLASYSMTLQGNGELKRVDSLSL